MHPPTSLLDTAFYEILERHERENDFRVIAEFTAPLLACLHCKSDKISRNGTRSALFMDLPMHGKRVGVEIIRQRYICRQCKKTSTQPLLGIDEKRDATVYLVNYIKTQASSRTFTEVANEVGVSLNTVKNIFDDYVKSTEEITETETPVWLGIDEIHINKHFRCVITNVKERTLFDILAGRGLKRVAWRLSGLPNKEKVEIVALDMWYPYREAAKYNLPQARIIVDKFHVLKKANEATETVRRSIGQQALNKSRKKLVKDRFVFLKDIQSLNVFDRVSLDLWSRMFPLLGRAYRLKEEFYQIYKSSCRAEAMDKYAEWRANIPKELEAPFKPLLSALTNWEEQIFAYFDVDPYVTNAYTESINNMIRHVNRNGRGYAFETLRAKLLFFGSARKRKPPAFQRTKWDETTSSRNQGGGLLYKLGDNLVDVGADIDALNDLFMYGEI